VSKSVSISFNMMSPKLFLLLCVHLCSCAVGKPRQRCRYGTDCWPDTSTWQSFNNSVSGRLLRTFPAAAVCHEPKFSPQKCKVAKESWDDSFWRTDQAGAMTAIFWETGNQQCSINSNVTASCQAGLGEILKTVFLADRIWR
jgi:hypothetical protein